eukprot:Skav223300  [mRNA]  locus=scaffold4198:125397:125633:+ [translate_table: standard]
MPGELTHGVQVSRFCFGVLILQRKWQPSHPTQLLVPLLPMDLAAQLDLVAQGPADLRLPPFHREEVDPELRTLVPEFL